MVVVCMCTNYVSTCDLTCQEQKFLEYDMDMNQKWTVVYYTTERGDIPVKEFLDEAKPTVKTKVLRILMHCEEYGLQGIIPHIKKLTGTPLWEIRISGTDSVRVLFMTQIGKRILLLHAFYKKTQKTPAKELHIALFRLKDYGGDERS